MNATNLRVLNLYTPDLRPSRPPEPLGGAGGFSGASFWRFFCARGEFALKAWPVDGPDSTRLGQIHRWMGECVDFPVIPIPERTADGRSFVSHAGRLWELTRWMPGRPSPLWPINLGHVERGFSAIAAIHRRLEHHQVVGESPGIRTRLRELDEFIHRTHAKFADAIRSPFGERDSELAMRWLSLARSEAPAIRREVARVALLWTPLQPCLRDARHAHLLFDGEELTGLIDFGAMGVDTVAGDLARLIGDWFAEDRTVRVVALRAYESVRPLSTAEHALITAFERANALLIGAHWLRWRFIEGRTFEQADAVTEGLQRSIERMTTMGH